MAIEVTGIDGIPRYGMLRLEALENRVGLKARGAISQLASKDAIRGFHVSEPLLHPCMVVTWSRA